VLRLEGRTALVTGSSRGLGAAMAIAMAAAGARVVVNHRASPDDADSVVRAIEELGGKAIAVQADCTVAEDVTRLVETAVAELGEVRVLVNNAGIGGGQAIVDTPVEEWDAMMASHLRSHFLVTKACLLGSMLSLEPLPGERRAAKIINIGSGLVRRTGRAAIGKVAYMTAKAGVNGFTQALAAELAPKITVNAIEPGIHFTGMVSRPPDDVVAMLDDLFLLGLAEDRDVASMATFLASADADHITAQIFLTSGGIS
jgi:3-oxoacyl-[acyl-carrier protein] reductase